MDYGQEGQRCVRTVDFSKTFYVDRQDVPPIQYHAYFCNATQAVKNLLI